MSKGNLWVIAGNMAIPMTLITTNDMDELHKKEIYGVPVFYHTDGRFWPLIAPNAQILIAEQRPTVDGKVV